MAAEVDEVRDKGSGDTTTVEAQTILKPFF
jgi:hypothetical protein